MTDKNELVRKISENEDDRLLLRRVLDCADRRDRQNIPTGTRFLSGRQQLLAQKLLQAGRCGDYILSGGYDEAERKLIIFLPEWMDGIPPSGEDSPLAIVRCEYSDKKAEISHRDVLGAIMGLGIERDTVGDILPCRGSADFFILRELLSFVLQSMEKAGRERLTLREISADELLIPESRFVLVRDTVSMTRLDAVLASGLGMAREKAAELVRSGKVRVEHTECLKPDRRLSEGCVISVRGRGKLELHEIGCVTRKGRTAIVIKKYI
ncbi:MAG: RNA-binding protein [Oscillospiraceae bacterium]|nr:RNA-binding protein [Oscillospiraceae bacterium]